MFSMTSNRGAAAYQKMGAASVVSDGSPQRMLLALFDALRANLVRSKGALEAGDAATKGSSITRAVRILEEGLRAGLDRSQSPELTGSLDHLYRYCVIRLTEANLYNDVKRIDEVIRLVDPIHDACRQVAKTSPAH